MLQKWKHIISNWINCYFNETDQDERTVNILSLLNIISHLRENLNLDESKSSVLEAHTVVEFILEKYPEFKFENGTVEATNEDEIYLVASLLLFFVCVNSKDVDIKNAMCSKLSSDDQEIILKFSKSLMECSPITCRDVQAAIIDACGSDMASEHIKVAETPPVLRSLHGEVRRLQAALDAERFDRNYLQEELTRTNNRLEKLTKDKEQYKLEIMDLKTKMSMCCGQEQAPQGVEAEVQSCGKLARQLQDMEERLVRTQEMLEDTVYERDTYKAKLDELKQDRDKWLSLSQQESARAVQLAEELNTERRHMQSLRELVTELRQHNRLNGLDTSQLECDDADASLQSLQQNLSVCSEACANVIEVQLSEERAKVEALKQQLQRLQDGMNELTQKTESEKLNFEKIISDQENNILNLKHRINEEIEEKNYLKSHYGEEMIKLNNEINELEQKIKDNNDHSRQIIEKKMQEIKTLQEEKLSLLQSLSNENNKLENIIAGLKTEIETEKQARFNMRDSYENQMMKLNEKVLNRNNELVELQNNIFGKGEMIEFLQMDLRKEKEHSNKCHINVRQLEEQKRDVENKLQDKTDEMNAMQQSLEQNIATILKEIDHFKTSVANLQDHCRDLEQCKVMLESEIDKQTTRFEELLKETEHLKNTFSDESEKLKFELDEKNATISTLQTHLQDEIHFKIGLQEELQKLQSAKVLLSEELNKLTVEFSKVKIKLTEKERTIEFMESGLKEEKYSNNKLTAEIEKLNQELTKISNDLTDKNKTIELLNNTLETAKKSFEDEISDKNETIEYNNRKLANMTAKKETLQSKIDLMNEEKAKLEHDLVTKSKQISQLQAECEKMSKTIEENKKAIRSLDQNMTKEKHKYSALEKNFDTEMSKLMGKLNDTEKTIKELSSSSRKAIKNKDHQIHTLNNEIENLKRTLDVDKENMSLLHKERDALAQKLDEEISYKNKIEKEYQNQCTQLENITSQLNHEISTKNGEISTLKMELELAMKTVETKCKEIRVLGERITKEDQLIRDLAHQKTVETKDLQKKLNDLQSLNYELEQEVKKLHDCKKQAIESLQKENEQLQFAIEEDNSSHEVILKEKDCIIDRLERQLKVHTVQLESIRKEYENVTLNWEKYKVETKETLELKDEQIKKLTQELTSLQQNISELKNEKEALTKKLEIMTKEMKETEKKNKEEVLRLVETIAREEIKNAVGMKEKEVLQNQLLEEKAARDSLQTEKKHQSEDIKILVADKNELLNEKIILTQNLAEERSVRKIFEEERNALVSEKATIERKLLKQVAMTESLLEDKECLTQQLVEEKSAKELAEKEKENLLLEKHLIEQKISEVENNKEEMSKEIDHLIEKHGILDQQCMKERAINEVLKEEKTKLLQDLTEEKYAKDVLLKENDCLVNQNESLKHDLLEQKAVQEVLITDKESLLVEKEGLVKSLGVEKSAHDEIETEKDQLITKLCEMNENYSAKANSVKAELEKVTETMNNLQMDYKNQEDLNSQITTSVNVGLEKLVEGLKKEGISNEVLQKLLDSENSDISTSDKCDLLINIANTLTTELVMRQNLEKALEHGNSSLVELREVLKQKELKTIELQTEIKRLQQIVNESKTELSKRNETYNTMLDSKTRELHALQKENQSLTNDLNDVKLQLEVKVHSLKEKIIDNENLTDKLKRTYECQIDNLNIMITKLTNYLKDKTVEVETVRKEKERVAETVEQNKKAIKVLEEEVKCKKLNQDKLINDFESERQVLKNMVTVTESIMEDQKVALNKIISEHLKTIEMTQEENRIVKESVEIERKEWEIKLQEKDACLDSLSESLTEVKHEKNTIEREIKALKELLDSEKSNLEEKMQEKETALETASKEIAELKHEKNTIEKEIKALKELFDNEKKNLEEKMQVKDTALETASIEIAQLKLEKNTIEKEIKAIKELFDIEKKNLEVMMQDKEAALETASKDIAVLKLENNMIEKEIKAQKDLFDNEKQNLEENMQKKETALETASKEIAELKLELNTIEKEMKALKDLFDHDKKNLEEKLQEKNTALETASKEIAELKLEKNTIEKEIKALKELFDNEKKNLEEKMKEKETALKTAFKEIAELKFEKEVNPEKDNLVKEIIVLKLELQNKISEFEKLQEENKYLTTALQKYKDDMDSLEKVNTDLKANEDSTEKQLQSEIDKLTKALQECSEEKNNLAYTLKEKSENIKEMEEKTKLLNEQINILEQDKNALEDEKNILLIENKGFVANICYLDSNLQTSNEKNSKLNNDNMNLVKIIENNKDVVSNLEQLLKESQQLNKKLCEDINNDKLNLANKCAILQEYHDKAEVELAERKKEITSLQKQLRTLQCKVELCEVESRAKDAIVSKISKEKDAIISAISKEVQEERAAKGRYEKEIKDNKAALTELRQNFDEIINEREALNILRKENEGLIKAIGLRDTFAAQSQERTASHKHDQAEKELRDLHHQVDNTSSDITHSSMESLKTISDLEKIIQDKNRTITTLHSDVTYLKTLMAESETKLLDVTKELEVSKENCHQLSSQLKKLVHQKNEEIADLKKQVTKMSATENRATQIIKVSAKYQAIILKRIAEIKTNTVLKELTNFGNSNYDSEVKRSLNAGSITMEDLENFLETTDRHLKKCSEKQLALQKERDRLSEVNKINESEIINLKKFLTELSVSFQTFSSVKDLYAQKLSRVISVQRTVRREILNLDGRVSDASMSALERGHAAAAQDLAECALSLERWVERCIGRTISAEKLKQAFMSDSERTSLATASFQNAGLEVQLDELDKCFQKLLEDVSRAQKGDCARDSQAATVMEVRAEYEDKLTRMKAKMKQLYTEQIAVFKEKQREEISMLERELGRARDKLAASSRAYEEHIRSLTTELWSVGEKFLMKKDEAEWLRARQRSGSLMSLQHVHSSGLVPAQEEPSRPSDSHSLRSLPINPNNGTKREGRGLHMSDEEGEVFDNRWLKELSATPRRMSAAPCPPGQRLSELRWRNSLCPPHLKSSYPAETQFTHAVDEEDIKCVGAAGAAGAKLQRKEVGITAYKKPGPPTPSKQAGRLSATDSELRESLRVEGEPQPSRKTSTPSRIRSLFRSSKNDTNEGTPRSRRLSNIFRKK